MLVIGVSGWFPESYVEKATTPGEGGLMEQGGMAETVEPKTVLEGIIIDIISTNVTRF